MLDRESKSNSIKYGNKTVVKSVLEGREDDLVLKTLYVPKSPVQDKTWQIVMIDSYCQAGKTEYTFKKIREKIRSNQCTLVLFVTQANSTWSREQTVKRAKEYVSLHDVILPEHMYNRTPQQEVNQNCMLVEYWNDRNRTRTLEWLSDSTFEHILVVIDECDQGGVSGVFDRIEYIHEIERISPRTLNITVIFVTATIANLSSSILKIATNEKYKNHAESQTINAIIEKEVVEHHFSEPRSEYVGISWYIDTPGVFREIVMPKKHASMSKDDFALLKKNAVILALSELPPSAKELSLVVTWTTIQEHSKLADRLLGECDYNVVVQVNCSNGKDFVVKYVSEGSDARSDADGCNIYTWKIPNNKIDAFAQKGKLKKFKNPMTRKMTCSYIESSSDYTMSHVLQAALFMGTSYQDRIKAYAHPEEYGKLEVLFQHLEYPILGDDTIRPDNYPSTPRVALVTGMMASRGVTIQNPAIDFTCTSFCFTGKPDTTQSGATNTQKIGRANGMLKSIFARPDRVPIMLATKGVMRDALANEMALEAKKDVRMVALKNLVTAEEYAIYKKRAIADVLGTSRRHYNGKTYATIEDRMLVAYFHIASNGTKPFTSFDVKNAEDKSTRMIEEKTNDRRYLHKFNERGFIESEKGTNGIYTNTFTLKGLEYIHGILP